MTIADGVFISDEVYLENEYPECIEIGERVQIGIRAIVLAHTRGPGRVVFEKFAYVGPNALILGVGNRQLVIGEAAVVAAGSVVTMSVPAYTLVKGNPQFPLPRSPFPPSHFQTTTMNS